MTRAGFSNSTLIAAIAVLAVVSLLLQIQSGQINPLAMFEKAPPAAGAGKGKGKKGKPPELYAAEPTTQIPAQIDIAELYVLDRLETIAGTDKIQRETWQAVAHMDSTAAATMLSEMDIADAVDILAHMRERELARIFDAAHPMQASLWVVELMKKPDLPEIPEQFKAQARAAGLLDDMAEVLAELDSEALPGTTAEAATTAEDAGAGVTETTPDDAGNGVEDGEGEGAGIGESQPGEAEEVTTPGEAEADVSGDIPEAPGETTETTDGLEEEEDTQAGEGTPLTGGPPAIMPGVSLA